MSVSLLKSILLLTMTALALLVFSLHYDPQRPHALWLRRGICGLMLLCAWNALPLPALGVNPLSVLVTGSLGLPGLGLMAVANALP